MTAACGCGPGGKRCPEANSMWEAAGAVYRARGYDAWLRALEPYNEHNALVFAELTEATRSYVTADVRAESLALGADGG